MKKIKMKQNILKIKRKKIPAKIRMPLILILGILTISSLFFAGVVAVTPEGPETIEQKIPICSYNQNSRFNYVVYLTNNTVYETTTLLPGQATIFKKITDYIDASFDYSFDISCQSTIRGSYTLVAQIQTDIWTKEYTIAPKKEFDTNSFTAQFDINISHYENILHQINEEIGITAQEPKLIISCRITTRAVADQGVIYESFAPTIDIPLNGNIIEINGNLSQVKTGALEKTYEIPNPEKNHDTGSTNSLVVAAVFFMPIIPLVTFTKNDYTTLSKTEKEIKKIMKKYGEWIVEVDKPPRKPVGLETIYVKNMDDLVKTSEELGKPIMHYASTLGKIYTFHVLDSTAHYEYILSEDEKVKKTVRCPDCNIEIECEGKPGETVHVECLKCGKKGAIDL